MKMVFKRIHRNIWLLAAIFCLMMSGLFFWMLFQRIEDDQIWIHSAELSVEDFDANLNQIKGTDQYLTHVPMEEMDLPAFSYTVDSMCGFATEETYHTCILPINLTYYRQQDGKMLPALVIEKGTAIALPAYTYYGGYGFGTFPTYEKGWRYGVPFVTEDVLSQWKKQFLKGIEVLSQADFDYYYVRLEDLKVVANAFQVSAGQSLPTNRQMNVLLLSFDKELARHHAYISPDLQASISWEQYFYPLIVACIPLFAAISFICLWNRKRKSI